MLLDLTQTALRWRHHRSTWRPMREPFNPAEFTVVPLQSASVARSFVETHHYSRSFPVALASYGLFQRTARHTTPLVGVAVFSVPIQPRAANSYGAGPITFCDLGRFILLDDIGGNAETWFLARALRLLAAEKTTPPALVIAYSDPMPRSDKAGKLRFAGHFGGIYRDSSGLYLGRTKPRRLFLTETGTIISDRALSKLRTDDRGAAYAYATLRSHGAPARAPGEGGAAYVTRALTEGPFRSVRHKGNHIYAFPLGNHASRRTLRQRLNRDLLLPTHTDRPVAA